MRPVEQKTFTQAAHISREWRAELRDLARDIAHEAGALGKELRRGEVDVAATKSTDTDVVTVADTSAENLVRELSAQHRPDEGTWGEEDGLAGGTSGLTWAVEPLDRPVSYLH